MKNKLKRVTIATLSACMIANAVPIPGNVAKAAVTQEMIDFTDENSQGGWVKDGANGTITFQNGEYYGAAEPPVRCGESHLSGLTEPPQFKQN